jgi:hypothetical protein
VNIPSTAPIPLCRNRIEADDDIERHPSLWHVRRWQERVRCEGETCLFWRVKGQPVEEMFAPQPCSIAKFIPTTEQVKRCRENATYPYRGRYNDEVWYGQFGGKQRYCGECALWTEHRRSGWPIERQDTACREFWKDTPADHCIHCHLHEHYRTSAFITCDRGGRACWHCCLYCTEDCPRTDLRRMTPALLAFYILAPKNAKKFEHGWDRKLLELTGWRGFVDGLKELTGAQQNGEHASEGQHEGSDGAEVLREPGLAGREAEPSDCVGVP